MAATLPAAGCVLFYLRVPVLHVEKTLRLGKAEGRRKRGRPRMKWLGGITNQWT